MFAIQMIQASYGDCFILEYGDVNARRYMLIDGGPGYVYENHLRRQIKRIADQGGSFDAVVVSHVDSDHITGVNDLMAELVAQHQAGGQKLINIAGVWHNSFRNTIDNDGGLQARVMAALALTSPQIMHDGSLVLNGISQGNRLRIFAAQMGVPINEGFSNNLICVDDVPGPVEWENLRIHIVGPTRANLDELRAEWKKWLDDNEPALASGDPQLMAKADDSIPNLSSVMFIAEADGKTILFTGDGRSDHLLEGLNAGGHLDAEGKLHVDVLKVMHHGSNRNVDGEFFRYVTADTYLISAKGHPDNPDFDTLEWIVQAAHAQGRSPTLVFTNNERDIKKLAQRYPTDDYGYTIEVMPTGDHHRRFELA